jgi:hypothetical protein
LLTKTDTVFVKTVIELLVGLARKFNEVVDLAVLYYFLRMFLLDTIDIVGSTI